jgi:hypothetical protein
MYYSFAHDDTMMLIKEIMPVPTKRRKMGGKKSRTKGEKILKISAFKKKIPPTFHGFGHPLSHAVIQTTRQQFYPQILCLCLVQCVHGMVPSQHKKDPMFFLIIIMIPILSKSL